LPDLEGDTKGLNGVISLEGTLIGIGGAGIIALIYEARAGWTRDCILIVIARRHRSLCGFDPRRRTGKKGPDEQ